MDSGVAGGDLCAACVPVGLACGGRPGRPGRAPVFVHVCEPNRRAIAFYECVDGVIRLDDGDGSGVAAVGLVLS